MRQSDWGILHSGNWQRYPERDSASLPRQPGRNTQFTFHCICIGCSKYNNANTALQDAKSDAISDPKFN